MTHFQTMTTTTTIIIPTTTTTKIPQRKPRKHVGNYDKMCQSTLERRFHNRRFHNYDNVDVGQCSLSTLNKVSSLSLMYWRRRTTTTTRVGTHQLLLYPSQDWNGQEHCRRFFSVVMDHENLGPTTTTFQSEDQLPDHMKKKKKKKETTKDRPSSRRHPLYSQKTAPKKPDIGSTVVFWNRFHDRFQSIPLGSFQSHDWKEAEALLRAISSMGLSPCSSSSSSCSPQKLVKPPQERIREVVEDEVEKEEKLLLLRRMVTRGFALLDRLCEERTMVVVTTNQIQEAKDNTITRNTTSSSGEPPPPLPLHPQALHTLLMAWQQTNGNSSDNDDHHHPPSPPQRLLLDPMMVLDKVNQCLSLGVFSLHSTLPYDCILQVLLRQIELQQQQHQQASMSSSSLLLSVIPQQHQQQVSTVMQSFRKYGSRHHHHNPQEEEEESVLVYPTAATARLAIQVLTADLFQKMKMTRKPDGTNSLPLQEASNVLQQAEEYLEMALKHGPSGRPLPHQHINKSSNESGDHDGHVDLLIAVMELYGGVMSAVEGDTTSTMTTTTTQLMHRIRQLAVQVLDRTIATNVDDDDDYLNQRIVQLASKTAESAAAAAANNAADSWRIQKTTMGGGGGVANHVPWVLLEEWVQRRRLSTRNDSNATSATGKNNDNDHSSSAAAAAAALSSPTSVNTQSLLLPPPPPHPSTVLAVVTMLTGLGHIQEATYLVKLLSEQILQKWANIDSSNHVGAKEKKKDGLTLLWAHAKVRSVQGVSASVRTALSLLFPELQPTTKKHVRAEMLIGLDSDTWDDILSLWTQYGHGDACLCFEFVVRTLRHRMDVHDRSSKRVLFNQFLAHCAEKSTLNGVQVTQDLVQWMEPSKDPRLQPDVNSYFYVLLTLKNAGQWQACANYLVHLCDRMKQGQLPCNLLDQRMFLLVLAAQLKHDNPGRCRWVLEAMRQVGLKPNVHCYNALLAAHAKSTVMISPSTMQGDGNTEEQAEDPAKPVLELFLEMKQEWENGGAEAQPNQATYDSVLLGLSRSLHPEALLDGSEVVLQEMKDLGWKPSLSTYRAFMTAWVRFEQPEKVEEMFQAIRNGYLLGELSTKPNSKEYFIRLHGWSKAGNPSMTKMVLQEMLREYELGSLSIKPGRREFTELIQAWANSKEPNAAQEAELQLREMRRLAQDPALEGDNDFQPPNAYTYTAVIQAYAHSDHIDKALLLLDELHQLAFDEDNSNGNNDDSLRPNVHAYNAIFSAFPDGTGTTIAEQAQALFEQMKKYGIQPNVDTYRALFATFSRRKKTVASLVEEVFQDMKRRYEIGGDESLQPDFTMYLTRLLAWSKARNAYMAHQVLNEMILLACSGDDDTVAVQKPGTAEFNMVLRTWMRSDHDPQAANQAELLLCQMQQHVIDGELDCHPDVTSYNHVLGAMAKSGLPNAGTRALRLFTELVNASQEDGDGDGRFSLVPDSVTFLELITVLSRSDLSRGEETIRYILQELDNKELSFWKGRRGRQLLFKVGQILASSSFLHYKKNELLADFERLKSKVLTMKKQREKEEEE